MSEDQEVYLPPYLIYKILNELEYKEAVENLSKLADELDNKKTVKEFLAFYLDLIQMIVITKIRKGLSANKSVVSGFIEQDNFDATMNSINTNAKLDDIRKKIKKSFGIFLSRLEEKNNQAGGGFFGDSLKITGAKYSGEKALKYKKYLKDLKEPKFEKDKITLTYKKYALGTSESQEIAIEKYKNVFFSNLNIFFITITIYKYI